MVIVHRGGEGSAPENTLSAFADTARCAAASAARSEAAVRTMDPTEWWAETDLRATADGHLVLIHDTLVDRTTNGEGALSSFTLEELRELDAGQWLASRVDTGGSHFSWSGPRFAGQRVPTLVELFDRFHHQAPELNFMLEVKELGGERGVKQLVQEIRSRPGLAQRCIIIGFDPVPLEHCKALEPTLRVGFTASEPTPEKIERAIAMSAHHIGVAGSHITPDLVASCKARGLEVRWTGTFHSTEVRPRQPNEPEQWAEIARLVHCGVCGIVHSDGRLLEAAIRSAATAETTPDTAKL